MLPLWLSRKSALDLVATLEPGDAVLAGVLAVLQDMQAQGIEYKGCAGSVQDPTFREEAQTQQKTDTEWVLEAAC